MRQTFTFAESSHKPPQALAVLKNRIRKYIKRERRKALPENVDFWDFDCRVGEDEATAPVVHVAEIMNRMDQVFQAGNPKVYIEILAKPAVRMARVGSPADQDDSAETDDSSETDDD